MKNILFLFIALSGSVIYSQSSDIQLNATVSAENNQIKNVLNPTDSGDAVNLGYLNETLDTYQNQIDDLQSLLNNLQLQLQQVVDQDGNSYSYLFYGNQAWTVKNADMVTYRDGTTIPQVSESTEFANLTSGAWCFYNNDPTMPRFYNWYAVMGIHDTDPNTPNKELAPEGWHVPSDAEWTTLTNHLIDNGYNYDGTTTGNKIAKAMAATKGWYENLDYPGSPGYNQSTNNSSGFNIYPFGTVSPDGNSINAISNSVLWSSTEMDSDNSVRRILHWGTQSLTTSSAENKKNFFSVRFVKE